MWDLSRRGLSVVFVSTELEELLEVCHRILIMENGSLRQEVTPETTTLDELYALCMEA
jgi:ribose transport system ATP-binding protein